jgi:hypothetical protein
MTETSSRGELRGEQSSGEISFSRAELPREPNSTENLVPRREELFGEKSGELSY